MLCKRIGYRVALKLAESWLTVIDEDVRNRLPGERFHIGVRVTEVHLPGLSQSHAYRRLTGPGSTYDHGARLSHRMAKESR